MDAEHVKLERRQLVILGARLNQFNQGEISLKKLFDDGSALIDALTILPLFWKDSVSELLVDVDVSLGMSMDSRREDLGPKDVAVAEAVWSLAKLVEEIRRRLELLNGPLSRFAFADPLMTREDLPPPETPVTHVKVPRGMSTVTFFRLLAVAPLMVIFLPICPGLRVLGRGILRSPRMYWAVMLSLDLKTSSGVPSATISPP